MVMVSQSMLMPLRLTNGEEFARAVPISSRREGRTVAPRGPATSGNFRRPRRTFRPSLPDARGSKLPRHTNPGGPPSFRLNSIHSEYSPLEHRNPSREAAGLGAPREAGTVEDSVSEFIVTAA